MQRSRWTLVFVAIAFLAAGVFPLLDALGVFPGSESRLAAPRWVVLVVASLFILCGAYALLLAVVGEAMARGFGAVVGIAVVVGLGAALHWIAFGGGDRSDCSGGVSGFGIGFARDAAELECRAAFGWFALMLDALLLNGTAMWLAKRSPGSRGLRAFETISRWALGLVFLPLIAIVAIFARARDWKSRFVKRRADGRPGGPPKSG